MSPGLALAYLFWTQHRPVLTLLGGYWLLVMMFYLAVPTGYFVSAADDELWFDLTIYALFCTTFLLATGAIAYLILVFTFSREARLEACESGFPARLLTLPLTTPRLVSWTMLWGSVTMILGWVTLGWATGRPYGFDTPLVWPALLLAVVLAWLQAILWTPFPLPWVRVLLMIPVATIFVCTPLTILEVKVPSLVVSGVLALLLPAAYLTAIWGVARARRGDNVTWTWPAFLRGLRTATSTRRPFASPLDAQRWLEWRQHGLAFPIVVVPGAIIALPLILLAVRILDDNDRFMRPIVPPWLLHHVGSLWLALAGGLLVGMPFLAAALGIEMGRFGQKTYRLPSFLGTRPVSEAMLVRAKFESAAWSTLAGWGVLGFGLLLWFALGGHATEAARQFEAMRQRHAPCVFWSWLILLVVGSIMLTWLQMVQRMWIGLSGNQRLIGRYGYSLIAVAVVVLIVFSIWLVSDWDYAPILHRLLPWLAGAAVIFKNLAAVWSLGTLRQRELIPPDVLWGMLLIWHTFALVAFTVLYVVFPADGYTLSCVVLGMVLLLPLTRLALAPLALFWNRHR